MTVDRCKYFFIGHVKATCVPLIWLNVNSAKKGFTNLYTIDKSLFLSNECVQKAKEGPLSSSHLQRNQPSWHCNNTIPWRSRSSMPSSKHESHVVSTSEVKRLVWDWFCLLEYLIDQIKILSLDQSNTSWNMELWIVLIWRYQDYGAM